MKAVKDIAKVSILFLMVSLGHSLLAQSSYHPDLRLKPSLLVAVQKIDSKKAKYSLQKIESPIKINNLPLFCQIEHKMSTIAKLPVRIRLGSVDYVNKLEKKQ